MKLSLIAAGLAIAVSAFTINEVRHLAPSVANAATNAEMTVPAQAPLPPLLPVPAQIGGQKIAPAAQEGVSCLIDTKNDKDACGDVAMKREIARCVGGIGVKGGCFDFFGKQPIPAEAQSKPRRKVEPRRVGTSFHPLHHIPNYELRMLARAWF